MNEALKPCPFCGGAGELRTITRKGSGGCDLFTWGIKCLNCGGKVPSCDDEAVRDDNGIRLTVDGRESVIVAWNRRTEDTQPC